MRAPASIVIAVRKPDDNIVIRREKLTPLKERFLHFKWPILRGIAVGGFTIAITMMVSFALGIGLFVILPERLANLVSERSLIFNAADGALRLTIFLAYILIISRSKYIARVFEYHGAEHKSINT